MSAEAQQLTLALDGFEGPLDLLLDLARRQKVDLARISVVALVDQYLAYLAATRPRLEVAADYLVMAAWLAYLKSRLLLPEDPDPEPDAAVEADRLRHRLARLEAMREAARALDQRPRLGREIFARGAPEGLRLIVHHRPVAALHELIAAYGAVCARGEQKIYRPKPRTVMSIEAARQRLADLLGEMPPWSDLLAYLPPELAPDLARAAHASLLVAALELVRTGKMRLRQASHFAPLELHGA